MPLLLHLENTMYRRHPLLVLASLSAIGLLGAGCDDAIPATPQVVFAGRLEIGQGNDCSDSGGLFKVGDFGNQALGPEKNIPSSPVKDGDQFEQGTVSVSCSVVPAGGENEFDVQAAVNLSGATGGYFSVDGHFSAVGQQENIHAIFSSRKSGNAYEQKDRKCVVRYTTDAQGIAAGRVWGEITCPTAENSGAQKTCQAVATFRFENCSR